MNGIFAIFSRDDDDYDIDFYTVEPITNEMDGGQSSLSPREQYEVRYSTTTRLYDFRLNYSYHAVFGTFESHLNPSSYHR